MEQQQSTSSCGPEDKTRIIYSCSGIGSNVGQLAKAAACQLANERYGGGSCLAGIGGSYEKLVGIGKTTDERIVIDGCPVAYAKMIMDDKGLMIDRFIMITELGIVKTPGATFNENDLKTVIAAVRRPLP